MPSEHFFNHINNAILRYEHVFIIEKLGEIFVLLITG